MMENLCRRVCVCLNECVTVFDGAHLCNVYHIYVCYVYHVIGFNNSTRERYVGDGASASSNHGLIKQAECVRHRENRINGNTRASGLGWLDEMTRSTLLQLNCHDEYCAVCSRLSRCVSRFAISPARQTHNNDGDKNIISRETCSPMWIKQ